MDLLLAHITCCVGLHEICSFITALDINIDNFYQHMTNLIKQFKFEYAFNLGLLVTFAGLITTWVKNWKDVNYKRSDFFLNEIKSYFDNAIALLSKDSNLNVKWHNAIYSLKRAIEMSSYIKQEEHKKIYVTKYIDTTYKIGNIIKEVDSFKFFYGRPDYISTSAKKLHASSKLLTSNSFSTTEHPSEDKTYDHYYRISTNALSFLCHFLHKANEIENETRNRASRNEYYDSSFEFNLLSKKIIDGLLSEEEMYWYCSFYPQIIDYIIDYELYRKKKV